MASVSRSDIARLVLRVGVGGVMAAHGTQKLFGWFGGGGLTGTAGHLESAGFRPGRLSANTAGVTETAGGMLLAAGLSTPVDRGGGCQHDSGRCSDRMRRRVSSR